MKIPVYLDYNATTPVDQRVLDEMLPYFSKEFGNPSSSHLYGERARQAVFEARQKIAQCLGLESLNIFFTSCATESNNIVLFGTAFGFKEKGNHIISQKTEHPSVLEPLKELQRLGYKVTLLNVDSFGLIDPDDLKRAITPETILISIMHANNETGTLQPIEEIGKISKEYNVLFHTDASQSLGKEILDLKEIPFDFLTFSAHKLYGPKGIGLLIVKDEKLQSKIRPSSYGGGQERNLKPGTLNVPSIVGMAKAIEISKENMEREQKILSELSTFFLDYLKDKIKNIKLNGHPERRLKGTLNLSVKGIDGNMLVQNVREVCFSTGSACHSGEKFLSYVLEAMGIEEDLALGALRFSFGRFTTKEEVQFSAEKVSEGILNLLK
ncbi:MAG: cysteine desulfurase family protein [Thermoanaerobaculia bacterium]